MRWERAQSRPAPPSLRQPAALRAELLPFLTPSLAAAVSGARRRVLRDGDRQIDTAHLLHSLVESDPEAAGAFEGREQLARVLGYLVQRSIGYGLRWQRSVEDSAARRLLPATRGTEHREVRAPVGRRPRPPPWRAPSGGPPSAASRRPGASTCSPSSPPTPRAGPSRCCAAPESTRPPWSPAPTASAPRAKPSTAPANPSAAAPATEPATRGRLNRCNGVTPLTAPCHDDPMHASQGRSAGLGLALASAFAFGGSGVAAKPLIEAGLDPLHVVWLRVAGAALVMLPVAWRHRDLLRRKPALLLGFGLLAVAGVQAFYFASISRIPVGVALLVEYLAPALVLGWVRFVQRRPVTRAAAFGVVLAVGGLACVVQIWSGLSFDLLGLLLALAAACCQVGYFVLSDQGADEAEPADPVGVIAYGLIVGALVLTVVARPWGMDWAVSAAAPPWTTPVCPPGCCSAGSC